MLPLLIGAGLGLLGSLIGGSSRPNVQTVKIPKPKEYTDFLKQFLGVWTKDEEGNKVFMPSPYVGALLKYQNFYRNPPVLNIGGIQLPALGLLNAYGRALSPVMKLAQETYYPLQVNQIASPSFGQMLGGALMGAGDLVLGFGLRKLLRGSAPTGSNPTGSNPTDADLGGGSFGIDFDPTLDPFG